MGLFACCALPGVTKHLLAKAGIQADYLATMGVYPAMRWCVCVGGWVGGGVESSPTDRNLMEPLLQIRGRRRKEAEAGGRTRRAPPLSHLDVSMDNTSIRVCVKKPQDGCTIPQNLHSCFPWKNRVTSCQPRTEHYCSSLRIN
jgi:hypothetical protein